MNRAELFVENHTDFQVAEIHHPSFYQQQKEWILYHIQDKKNLLNMTISLGVEFLDKKLNEIVLKELIQRHEALRTIFRMIDGDLVQVVLPIDNYKVNIEYIDISQQADSANEVNKYIKSESEMPFDFERGPLFRVKWLILGDRKFNILFTAHHVITDFISFQILREEIALLYESKIRQTPSKLTPVIHQYGFYADLQNQVFENNELRNFWINRLKGGIPDLEIIPLENRIAAQEKRAIVRSEVLAKFQEKCTNFDKYDFCLGGVCTRYNIYPTGKILYRVGEETIRKLQDFSNQNYTTPFSILVANFVLLINKLSNQKRVAIDIPVLNRPNKGFKNTFGWLTVAGQCRLEIQKNQTISQFLEYVNLQLLEAYEYSAFPYESLCQHNELKDNDRWSAPSFLNYMLREHIPLEDRRIGLITNSENAGFGSFDLFLSFYKYAAMLELETDYRTDLFTNNQAIELINSYFNTLNDLTQTPLDTLVKQFLEK